MCVKENLRDGKCDLLNVMYVKDSQPHRGMEKNRAREKGRAATEEEDKATRQGAVRPES